MGIAVNQIGLFPVKFSILIQVVVCLFSVIAVLAYAAFPEQFVRLCDEDGFIENLTSLAFLIAGVAFLYQCRKSEFRSIVTAGLGVLCVVAAGEEISWGQRVFGIQTPESLRAVNVQHELNLHNLEWIQGHYRVVMLAFLIAFCLLLPAATYYLENARRFVAWCRLPLFPLRGVPAMMLAIAFMAVPRMLRVENFRDLDEVGEFLVAFGFCLYALRPSSPAAANPRTDAKNQERPQEL